jgi:hypothetical protein
MSRITAVDLMTKTLDRHKQALDGVGRCGHWDSELDRYGFCRDSQCRHDRVIKAVQNGKARMTTEFGLVWIVD